MTQMELTEEQSERIKDFVAALRSGDYAQTIQQLGKVNDDDGVKCYCCEGVAVERYARAVGYDSRWESNTLMLVLSDDDDSQLCSDYAEDEFWEALALSTGDDNGSSTTFAFIMPEGQDVLCTGAESVSYMSLNDDGFTFAQIADLIEWQYLS